MSARTIAKIPADEVYWVKQEIYEKIIKLRHSLQTAKRETTREKLTSRLNALLQAHYWLKCRDFNLHGIWGGLKINHC